jgi:3-hydroxyacyl-[acyl-carrier-protein] dehydratase
VNKRINEFDFDKPMPWEAKDIAQILPHRYPFLLIDRVVSLEGGEEENRKGRIIKCIKNVTQNEPYFTGHFPENPVLPGVIQVEAMAQASALVAARKLPEDKQFVFFLASCKDVKFRRPVIPGDQLVIYATIVRDRKKLLSFSCRIEVDGKSVSEADIMASLSEVAEDK